VNVTIITESSEVPLGLLRAKVMMEAILDLQIIQLSCKILYALNAFILSC
jgi:hypothetical protein